MENNPPRNTGDSVAKNMAWSVIERVTSQFLHTVLSIVLARLLLPEDYGFCEFGKHRCVVEFCQCADF